MSPSSASRATSSSRNGPCPNPIFLKDFTRAGFGIDYPLIYNASSDIPQVAVGGFTTLSVTSLNFDNFNRIFDWKDDVTKISAITLENRRPRHAQPQEPGHRSGDQRPVQFQHLAFSHQRSSAGRRADWQLLSVHRSQRSATRLVPVLADRAIFSGRLEGEPSANCQPRPYGGRTCSRSTAS